MNRYKVTNRGSDQRYFSNTGRAVHKVNSYGNLRRGGYRL